MLDLLKNKLVISLIISVVVIIAIYVSNRNLNDNEKPKMMYYVSRLLISFGVIYGVVYLYDMMSSNKNLSLGGGFKKAVTPRDSVFCDNPKW